MSQDQTIQTATTQDAAQDVLAHPHWPQWPTSKPGPQVTEPPLGQKRNPHRTEQVNEVAYDQETGASTARA